MIRSTLALLMMVAVGCAGTPTPPVVDLPQAPTSVRLRRLNGQAFDLAALRGQAVLINLIQSWASPALVEVPLLNRVANRYGDRLTVLCIALDDRPEMVRIFVKTFEPEYEVLQVEEDLEAFLGEDGPFGPITRVPTSVLLDADGRIVARNDGTWQPQLLLDTVERLVASAP